MFTPVFKTIRYFGNSIPLVTQAWFHNINDHYPWSLLTKRTRGLKEGVDILYHARKFMKFRLFTIPSIWT